jgi:hypothetical protein
VRYTGLPWLPLGLLLLAAPAPAQTSGRYSTPTEFMELFFDFTGSNEPDYPAGQPTLGQMLTQSVIAKESQEPPPAVEKLSAWSDLDFEQIHYDYAHLGIGSLGSRGAPPVSVSECLPRFRQKG